MINEIPLKGNKKIGTSKWERGGGGNTNPKFEWSFVPMNHKFCME